MNKSFRIIQLMLTLPFASFSQRPDTISITPNTIRISQLNEGSSRYLVYYQKGTDAPYTDIQIWNIEVSKEIYRGNSVVSITQKWNFKDSVYHTAKSICSAKDFRPLYHESWWLKKDKETFDPLLEKVWLNEREITAQDTGRIETSIYNSFHSSLGQYNLNWHLDLEVFSLLPYRMKRTFLIPFYEFGYDIPRPIAYTVTGAGMLEGFDGQKTACWLLEHTSEGNRELFWISKKTNQVLKLEQVIQNRFYRKKVRL